MHKAVSVLLIFILAFQTLPVQAEMHEEHEPPSKRDRLLHHQGNVELLQERLRNIPGEAERFLESRGPTGIGIRYVMHEIRPGTPMELYLSKGERVTGRLGDINVDGFTLDNGRYVEFSEVVSVHVSGPGSFASTTNYLGVLVIVGALVVAALVIVHVLPTR